jgi:Domain of unknown function (DUF4395)
VTTGRPAVFNEIEVRAAAGLTMATGAVAFAYAYFDKQYLPLQVVASLFFVEFLIRVAVGLRFSPFGVVAGLLTRGRAPEWVSAPPKRFAWSLGLAIAFAMTIITNVGIRGYLPRTMCLICLTLMWMESALGLCLGCKIHGLLVRSGWAVPGAEPCVECAVGASVDHHGPRHEVADPLASAAGGQDQDEPEEVQEGEEIHHAVHLPGCVSASPVPGDGLGVV